MFELVSISAQRESFKPQAVATYILQRLLIPGEVSFSALAETLTELGKPVTREQLEDQSTAEIVGFLVSVSSCFIRDSVPAEQACLWAYIISPSRLLPLTHDDKPHYV